MKYVLIIGSNGMLGFMVKRILSKNKKIKIISTSRKNTKKNFFFDLNESMAGLEKIFKDFKRIDYVINCIGVLNNEIDEKNTVSIQNAIKVNSLFPYQLANLTKQYNTKVLQISTDGVFSKESGVCTEEMLSHSEDIYGKTKKMGEVDSWNFLNLRCSIIGPSPNVKKGILEWFLARPKNTKVNGFINQKWNGVTTLQFADLCDKIISKNFYKKIRSEGSIHHFCPNESINKFDLLTLFKRWFRSDLEVISVEDSNNLISRSLETKYLTIASIFKYDKNLNEAIMHLKQEMNYST